MMDWGFINWTFLGSGQKNDADVTKKNVKSIFRNRRSPAYFYDVFISAFRLIYIPSSQIWSLPLCLLRFPRCLAPTERETASGKGWGSRARPRRRRRGFWAEWATARRATTLLTTGGTPSRRATCPDRTFTTKKKLRRLVSGLRQIPPL